MGEGIGSMSLVINLVVLDLILTKSCYCFYMMKLIYIKLITTLN